MDDSKIAALLAYLERGWALVPLHDVSAGRCSCLAGANCGGSAGKHPRYPRWQEDGQLVRERTVLEAIHLAHPEWNWGVATGRVSGIWVLDWDQDHDEQIRDWLVGRLGELINLPRHGIGMIPDLGTLTLGPTGGGGRHYVFELPPDFEVHGSQTRNRYGLPPGLDVRGWHGQVVVAPSVSGKGPYGGVLIDAPIRRAPAWLEDMLRRAQPVDNGVDGAIRGAPSGHGAAAQVSSGDPRAMAYAAAAVRDLLGELESAPVGTRNDTAYRVACRLVEIGNAPWTGYTVDGLGAAWWEAGSAHPDGAYVPASELAGVWNRAQSAVGERAAELPAQYAGGEHIPILDFPVAAGSSGGLPFTDPVPAFTGAVLPAQPPDPVMDPVMDPVTALIDRMLTPEQLRALPPPVPLINGLLDLNTCAWLIGRPGCGKSFVALDLAVHVGRGETWQGRPVRHGLVVYIVAEGAQGMRLRLDAVEREYAEVKDVVFLPEPVPADERRTPGTGAWSVLIAACRRLAPSMVIIDTQSRVTIGLSENDNSDMAYYAEQADRIKRACGACVLTVHHQGRTGIHGRGGSAIDGAQETLLRVERDGQSMVIKLHNEKQKDQAGVAPIDLALRRSEAGVSDAGRDLSSLVIERAPALGLFQDPVTATTSVGELRMIALYRLIVDRFNGGDGGTKAEIRKAFQALPDIARLGSADTRDKAWARAWNGTERIPGLVPRGLVAQRAGAARFKIIIIEDQSAEGALTPNDLARNPTYPPEGWNLYLPDLSGKS